MKTKMSLKWIGMVAILSSLSQSSHAQWNVGNAGGFNFGRTNPGVNPIGIGIGNFPNGTPPMAALNINTNAPFPTNTFFSAGDLFRTDGPGNVDNVWQMATTGGGAFNIKIPANTNDVEFNLQAVQNVIS